MTNDRPTLVHAAAVNIMQTLRELGRMEGSGDFPLVCCVAAGPAVFLKNAKAAEGAIGFTDAEYLHMFEFLRFCARELKATGQITVSNQVMQ